MAIIRGQYLLAAAALLASGCYSFRPASIESLPEGSVVRARLSPAGTQEVAALTGDASERVEGSFVRVSRDTLVLEVWRSDLRSDRVFSPGRLRVPLPRRYVVDVDERRLSVVRTGAVAAVVGAGLYQVVRLLWEDAGVSGEGDPGSGGPSIILCC